ncbi:hypothetical protein L6452_22370 [Arctium lappa]|uniref:Uncharacterized protein n=1 Tax=Arctium lappa TaxID=4217 RepID=A0ACB9B0I5_ARCLA|nr:hypothetical protein L6452_22370 [Arctium lappa]
MVKSLPTLLFPRLLSLFLRRGLSNVEIPLSRKKVTIYETKTYKPTTISRGYLYARALSSKLRSYIKDEKVRREYRCTLADSKPRPKNPMRIEREIGEEEEKSIEPEGHPVFAEEPSMPTTTPNVVSFDKKIIPVNTKVSDDEEEEETIFKRTKKASTSATTSAQPKHHHHRKPYQRPPLFLISSRTESVM